MSEKYGGTREPAGNGSGETGNKPSPPSRTGSGEIWCGLHRMRLSPRKVPQVIDRERYVCGPGNSERLPVVLRGKGGVAGRRDSKQPHDEEGALASRAADQLPHDNFTIALSMHPSRYPPAHE